MEFGKAKPIECTTYSYSAKGKTADGKTKWGKYDSKNTTATKDTSFGALKAKVFKDSKGRKDTFVEYGKRPLKSVTRRTGDTKTVTFFKRGK